MTRPYDGPEVRYDDPMTMMSAIPGYRLIVGGGAAIYHATGEHRSQKVAAQARGAIRLAWVSHVVYAILALILVFAL